MRAGIVLGSIACHLNCSLCSLSLLTADHTPAALSLAPAHPPLLTVSARSTCSPGCALLTPYGLHSLHLQAIGEFWAMKFAETAAGKASSSLSKDMFSNLATETRLWRA